VIAISPRPPCFFLEKRLILPVDASSCADAGDDQATSKHMAGFVATETEIPLSAELRPTRPAPVTG